MPRVHRLFADMRAPTTWLAGSDEGSFVVSVLAAKIDKRLIRDCGSNRALDQELARCRGPSPSRSVPRRADSAHTSERGRVQLNPRERVRSSAAYFAVPIPAGSCRSNSSPSPATADYATPMLLEGAAHRRRVGAAIGEERRLTVDRYADFSGCLSSGHTLLSSAAPMLELGERELEGRAAAPFRHSRIGRTHVALASLVIDAMRAARVISPAPSCSTWREYPDEGRPVSRQRRPRAARGGAPRTPRVARERPRRAPRASRLVLHGLRPAPTAQGSGLAAARVRGQAIRDLSCTSKRASRSRTSGSPPRRWSRSRCSWTASRRKTGTTGS